MSTRALADACANYGHPIPRSVLANLESGRRESITVPEVLVIARALEVPPMDLLLPLGHAEQVEILPGVSLTPAAALDWLAGRQPLLPAARWSSTSRRFYEHAQLVDGWKAERLAARNYREMPDEQLPPKIASYGRDRAVEQHEQNASRHLADLVRLRERMVSDGLTPPELPAELAEVVGAQSRGDGCSSAAPARPSETRRGAGSTAASLRIALLPLAARQGFREQPVSNPPTG